MKKFFSNIMNFFKYEEQRKENSATSAEAFQKVVESLDVDAIINYIESGGDVNVQLEKVKEETGGSGESYSYTVPIRALDLVRGKSEALTRLLEASGAKTQKQIAAEEEAEKAAKEEKWRALEEAKRAREAEEEAEREKERLAKVEAYLS